VRTRLDLWKQAVGKQSGKRWEAAGARQGVQRHATEFSQHNIDASDQVLRPGKSALFPRPRTTSLFAARRSWQGSWVDHRQCEYSFERVEVAIPVQERMSLAKAERRD
jgi:hypothetical protein